QWWTIQDRLRGSEAQRARFAGLVQRAASIESDWSRLAELRGALPHLGRVFDQRRSLEESTRRGAEWAEKRRAESEALAELARQVEHSRQVCASVRQSVERAAVNERESERRRDQLEKRLAVAEPFERHRRDLEEV